MADRTPHTGAGPDRGSTNGAPRWVKVAGIITLVVVVLLVIVLLVQGGHGPGRHTRSGGPLAPTVVAGHASLAGGRR